MKLQSKNDLGRGYSNVKGKSLIYLRNDKKVNGLEGESDRR